MSLRHVLILIAFCILACVPAGAVTLRHIDAVVAENGDMSVTATYSLDFTERVVAYPAALPLIIASPKKNIAIISVTPDETRLNIRNLVKVQQIPDARKYTTPAFSLSDARRELDRYWFGKLVTLDGSKGNLTIRFPDGEVIEHRDLSVVPSFEHVSGGL